MTRAAFPVQNSWKLMNFMGTCTLKKGLVMSYKA